MSDEIKFRNNCIAIGGSDITPYRSNDVMRPWADDIDPSTIPDDVLYAEAARRRGAKRKTFGAGPGRPKKLTRCRRCKAMLGVAEMRRHHCAAGGT